MYKVGLVVNGKSKGKKRILEDVEQLRKEETPLTFSIRETVSAGDGIPLSRELANSGCTHVIAVGGDGTLNEVVNGILTSDNTMCICGMLTGGTANDFARTIPSPRSVEELVAAVTSGSFTNLDVGLIEADEGKLKRYFINIASVGMSAEVVKRVNRSSKRGGPGLTFFKAIVLTFMHYRNQPLECKTPEWEWSGKANSLVIANARYFGNGMCIAPEADPADGLFSVMINGDINLMDYLRNVVKIKKGALVEHAEVLYQKANELRLDSGNGNCFIEADGEFIGQLPARVTLIKQKIPVLNSLR